MLGYLGEEMDPHVDACQDCRARRAEYDKIRAALARESERPVPAEWMEQMRARLRARLVAPPSPPVVPLVRRSPRRRLLSYGGMAAVASAAAVMGLIVLCRRPPEARHAEAPSVAVRFQQGPDLYRGSKHKGDVLHVTARAGDAERFELRIYRDSDSLVLRCPGAPAPACLPGKDGVKATYRFDSTGTYEVIWLTSDSVVAGPVGGLDADVRAARAAGADLATVDAINVL